MPLLNAIKVTKDAIRVISSTENMSITLGLIRARDLAHATYKKTIDEEQLKIDKKQQQRFNKKKKEK